MICIVVVCIYCCLVLVVWFWICINFSLDVRYDFDGIFIVIDVWW